MSLLKILGIDKYTERLKTWVNNRVDIKVANLVDSAPETLDTLKEVADAIQANETIVEALNAAIGNKADKTTVNTLNGAVASNTTSIKDINSALSTKANINGDYPDMSVGLAEDLGGRSFINKSEFSFRATAGVENSIKDGLATIVKLKGNSVVWNQKLIRNNETTLGITTTWVDNIATLSGIATSTYAEIQDSKVPVFNGHKYLVEGWVVSNPNSLSFGLGLFNNIPEQLQFDSSTVYKAGVFICNGNYRSGFGVNRFGGAGTDLTGLQLKARVIDLTQMFQAGNEPTTIEEYNARKPIVADEYAYNEGEVIHMTAEGIKSVGDNAWDEEWELGNIDGNTGELISGMFVRSKNPIPIIGGEQYFCNKKNLLAYNGLFCYDSEGAFIQRVDSSDGYYTLPQNAAFIRFRMILDYGTTYNNDIMISLVHSGWKQDTDAGYQPYWEDILPLPIIRKYFPQGMKSAGSAHDEIRFNKASGKWEMVKRIGIFDKWEGRSISNVDNPNLYAFPMRMLAGVVTPKPYEVICIHEKYEGKSQNTLNATESNGIAVFTSNRLWIKDMDVTSDPEALITKLSGTKLYYELAEPIVTELDAEDQNFNLDYRVADFGTEQAIAETNSAPISADIQYNFGANDTIRTNKSNIIENTIKIKSLEARILQLESILNEITTND